MFNPKFRKFGQKKRKIQTKSTEGNKITNFFSQKSSPVSEDIDVQVKREIQDDNPSKRATTGISPTTSECLKQFSRKRPANTQPACSSNKKTASNKTKEKNDSDGVKLTPFEQQIMNLKEKYTGMILMIQSGYKYFFYGEDAEIASKVLNIAVFQYHNFVRSSVPVERFPVHARKLVEAGHKIGVVQQQEVAELKAVGESKYSLFDRELTAVYTKSTAIGEDINPLNQATKTYEESAATFMLCLSEMIEGSSRVKIGIVAFDPSTGEAYFDEFEDGPSRNELERRLEHINPVEILSPVSLSLVTKTVLSHCNARVENLPDSLFNFSSGLINITTFLSGAKHEDVVKLSSIPPSTVCALSALLLHLKEINLQNSLKPESLQSFTQSELYVQLDGATVRSLEIFKSSEGAFYGSLLWLFDKHSHTHFGSRILREWLAHPLRDLETLKRRQDAITELLECSAKSVVELNSVLQKVPDVDRGLTAVLLNRSTPQSMFIILESLDSLKKRLEAIVEACDVCIKSPLLNDLITESILLLTNIPEFLKNINQNATSKGDVTNFLKDYSSFTPVTELQKQIESILNQLKSLLPSIAVAISANGLKYVSVYGEDYLIEVKIKQSVPSSWMKINETKQLSRYRPPEVAELYSQLTVLKAKLKQECQIAWKTYIDAFNKHYSDHKKAVKNLACLDALIALSDLARSEGYTRPVLIDDNMIINIKDGKHPIVSKLSSDTFIPNDTFLESTEKSCMVLSGPNMGGKSCYVRQVALLCIMALIGSYIPAEQATISVLDAIFTRIGARDEIFEGRSTLMLEMQETASILKKASTQSLVLIDELGRGTSSHDGAAVAVATLSYILKQISCLTLYITHYPSVMQVAPHFNYHMGFIVTSSDEDPSQEVLTFLYKVCAGEASHSYGLNVSRLAGIFPQVIQVAREKAENFRDETESRKKYRKMFFNMWKAKSTMDIKEIEQLM